MSTMLMYHHAKPQPSRRGHCLQKTGGGFGDLMLTAAQSRITAQCCGFLLRAPVLAARMGGRKACRLCSSAVGPVRQPVRAASLFGDGVAVVQSRQLEPIMADTPLGATAQIITHPRFSLTPVQQHPRRGRLPNSVIKFWRESGRILGARYLQDEKAKKIAVLREGIACCDRAKNNMLYELAYHQGQATQAKGASHV